VLRFEMRVLKAGIDREVRGMPCDKSESSGLSSKFRMVPLVFFIRS
jgi:hypothetical protein